MAKKLKKRKKLTRRARQQAPVEAKAAKTEKKPAGKPIRPQEPVGISREVPQAPPAPVSAGPTTVSFKDTSRDRAPDGIDSAIAKTEYPVIRRDLRKLGLTIIGMIVILVGLAVLNNATGMVNDLGEQLFKLWQ